MFLEHYLGPNFHRSAVLMRIIMIDVVDDDDDDNDVNR